MNMLQAAGGHVERLTMVDDEVFAKTMERMTFDRGVGMYWFAISVSAICRRSAALKSTALIAFGQASASIQIFILHIQSFSQ